jgi:hypothetical protein
MPKTPRQSLPQGQKPRSRSKFDKPLLGKPAAPRTRGGRLTYAGADFDEQRSLRALWESGCK